MQTVEMTLKVPDDLVRDLMRKTLETSGCDPDDLVSSDGQTVLDMAMEKVRPDGR